MDGVQVEVIRREQLRVLVREYGTQQKLADAVGVEQNYISQLITGKKPFGEKTAKKIEKATRRPLGWLSSTPATQPATAVEWPFAFDKALWDRLPAQQKNELEAAFQRLVLGASVEQVAAPPKKRKQA